MQHDFADELFASDVKQIIEDRRTICDLKSLLTKIQKKGAVSVGLKEGECFMKAMSAITDSCKSFSNEDILKLYREFLLLLEEVYNYQCDTL